MFKGGSPCHSHGEESGKEQMGVGGFGGVGGPPNHLQKGRSFPFLPKALENRIDLICASVG